MRHLLMLSVVALATTLHLDAQGTRARIDVSKLGPQVGQRVPDFTLVDQSGKEQTLQSIMGPRGAMLVFLRSADW
jgi:peroxiredoxin